MIANPFPLTHFIPAIGTTLISLGIMSKDGLVSILGVLEVVRKLVKGYDI
nr:exopolysaccharide biosynthesis protein [Wolbachia endosymbiont of Nilaparvata lugens]